MHLRRIKLAQFKNHTAFEAEFCPELNFIVGPNGVGKTNILEAISYLSLGKSAFFSHDRFTANQNQIAEPFFSTIGWFEKSADQDVKVVVSQQGSGKKTIRHDEQVLGKLAEHVGQFPMVMIAPDDVYLIRDGSEERRRFIDSILCQLDAGYLTALLKYNHVLNQRNALLKQFIERQYQDLDLLRLYHPDLVELGEQLSSRRATFISSFQADFSDYYQFLSKSSENPSIFYKPGWQSGATGLANQLEEALQHDLASGRTSVGPHKDDYEFILDDQPLKNFGSQGQQKSFLIALKLSQYKVLEDGKGFKPLLLLDDIFDKLDATRITALLELVSAGRFGQLFITDAQPARCQQWVQGLQAAVKIIKLPENHPHKD